MADYLVSARNIAAKAVAEKLNKYNKTYGLFAMIADTDNRKDVTAESLGNWAYRALDYLEEANEDSAAYCTIVELLFVAENAEHAIQYLEQ